MSIAIKNEKQAQAAQIPWYKKPLAKYALIVTGAVGITCIFFLREYYAHLEALRQASYKATVVDPMITKLINDHWDKKDAGFFSSEAEELAARKPIIDALYAIPSLPSLTMQEFFAEIRKLDIADLFQRMKTGMGFASA